MDCSRPGFPAHHQLRSLLKLLSIKSVMPSNHLILCRPLLLPPSTFPSIRVFSNESVLCIRQAKYWSFSFSIRPSNEYSGLISFRKAMFEVIFKKLFFFLLMLLTQWLLLTDSELGKAREHCHGFKETQRKPPVNVGSLTPSHLSP